MKTFCKWVSVAFAMVCATGAIAGCDAEEGSAAASEPEVVKAAEEAETAPTDGDVATADVDAAKSAFGGTAASKGQTGALVYTVKQPNNKAYSPYVAVMSGPSMRDAISIFNKVLTFPKDVPVTVTECGEANARYRGAQHDIELCYELIDKIQKGWANTDYANKTEIERLTLTAKALAFITLHEGGHAFLRENKIAVLGKEEDVVDELSGILFLGAGKTEVPYYGTLSLVATGGPNESYSDVHSFDLQRYFGILCLIYGSDPAKYKSLVGSEADNKLPPTRAARCQVEWPKKKQALASLVGPFVRK